MAPYRIITTRMAGHYLHELVRCYDGAIIAQHECLAPFAPQWMRDSQAKLNTKTIMETLGVL